MASRNRSNNTDHDKCKEENEMLKKKLLKLKQKYKNLTGSSDEDSSDDEIEQHPAKKRKMDKKPSMDPLIKLVPDCFGEVLKFLKPKELLDCKLVSKSWKHFIESRDSVMKRAMKKIVINMTSKNVKQMRLTTIDKILQSERGYKHMKAEFKIFHKIFRFPLENRAATLETLELTCVQWDLGKFVPQPLDFPKLKKLFIDCPRKCTHKPLISFIETCSFPELTHLKIGRFDSAKNLDTFIQTFPKMQVLSFDLRETKLTPREWNKEVKKFEPKLEAIHLSQYFKFFLRAFKDTLTEICINGIDRSELADMLENFKELKSLSIKTFRHEGNNLNAQLPRHDKLQTLRVGYYNTDELLRALLQALPSLSTLHTCYTSNNGFIQFLATNMKKLSKLICGPPQNSVIEYYDGLKASGNVELNTRFEICTPNDANRNNFDKEFNKRHFNLNDA